jgi:hypothetical protein
MGPHFSGTPPQRLTGWLNGQLPPSHMVCAWKGAQLAFGSTWITTVQSPAPVLQLPTTTAISGQSISVSLTPSQSQTSMSPTDQSESTAQTSVSSVSSVSFSAPTKLTSALKKPSCSTIPRTTESKLAARTPTSSSFRQRFFYPFQTGSCTQCKTPKKSPNNQDIHGITSPNVSLRRVRIL